MTKTIDEILRNVATMKDPRAEKEAKAAIQAMVEDIVGGDVPELEKNICGKYGCNHVIETKNPHAQAINNNHSKQRQRATEYNLDIQGDNP